MINFAESLNQVATDYKIKKQFNKAMFCPALSSEILFGLTPEERE
jgi:hypothetical protein